MLPAMDGVQLLTRIRSFHNLCRLAVFAYTNAFVPQLIEAARAAGATEVPCKSSLTPHILLRTIDAALIR